MELMHLFSRIQEPKTKENVLHVACVMKQETIRLNFLLSASWAEIFDIHDRIEKLYQHVS